MRHSRRLFVAGSGTVVATAALEAAAGGSMAAPTHRAHGGSRRSDLRDLARDATYTVTRWFPEAEPHDQEVSQYPDPSGALTDGRHAGPDYTDEGWVGYLRQAGRTIVVDLGAVQTVLEISIDFLYAPGGGVHLPGTVTYGLSEDGQAWRSAGSAPGDNMGTGNERRAVTAALGPTYARYVMASFDVSVWTFVDEIRVLGRSGVEHGARPPRGRAIRPGPGPDRGYLRQGTPRVGGVRNMYLAYTYDTRSPRAEVGTWRAENLLPVITHVDRRGPPTDWMFDTVLFMAGGGLEAYDARPAWDDLLDRLFEPGIDVDALDQATAEATHQLGRGTVSLMLPIPYPVPTADKPWGNLDGRQLDLNPERVGEEETTRNRFSVVRWYVGEALSRYRTRKPDHISLAGFYWMREAVPPRSADASLVRAVSTVLHRLPGSLGFYWIPWYQAPGFQHWQSYGFDASMMQANYAFDADQPPGDLTRLHATTELARWSGQGVEVECSSKIVTDAGARRKFLDYLRVYEQDGAGTAIKGYYLAARDVIDAMVGDGDLGLRRTYDAAYEFIRRTR